MITEAAGEARPFERLALRFLAYTGRLRRPPPAPAPEPSSPPALRPQRAGHGGVYWNGQRSKWAGKITIDGRRQHVGLFDCREDAERAVDRARADPEAYFENRRYRARRSGRRWQQWIGA